MGIAKYVDHMQRMLEEIEENLRDAAVEDETARDLALSVEALRRAIPAWTFDPPPHEASNDLLVAVSDVLAESRAFAPRGRCVRSA